MLTDPNVRCASVLENHAIRLGRAHFQTGSSRVAGLPIACAKAWEPADRTLAIGRCGFMVNQS
ncbi:hypothetical protein EN885_06085 [Mesorhizobium sp. M6A.T.Cr.TU.014.01.1.1]|nr:hypothetical protein EN885_06085 [Mesorhizobium sp. M6A.T.Cr.TU.014.01.1.1]RWP78471.1 MAG: hypothetical protein EOR10_12915 [Mesorhizobium sp.]RWQ00070.1 MAG: hypothetical protein EOR90_23320 [Mesorhizobium sp.]RWQ09768.1 MAG: hypothetical protein EOR91_08015 [Mesorhizobium sp.]